MLCRDVGACGVVCCGMVWCAPLSHSRGRFSLSRSIPHNRSAIPTPSGALFLLQGQLRGRSVRPPPAPPA